MTDRLSRILTSIGTRSRRGTGTRHLCEVAADVTGTNAAGIMLLSDDLAKGSLCATDELSSQMEELQYTLGEGPSAKRSAAAAISTGSKVCVRTDLM